MSLRDLIASPGHTIAKRLATDYRMDRDVHALLILEIDRAVADAVDKERERMARWMEAQGQPGYAAEIRHMK